MPRKPHSLGDMAKPKRGRPPLPPGRARVHVTLRVDPLTAEAIDGESERTGESLGQVVDRLAEPLRRRTKPRP